MKKFFIAAVLVASALLSGCERISTGEIGLRINMSKEVQSEELLPGSWNQKLIGDILTFPVKDITVNLENKTPMTADNSALADFDLTVVYGINPKSAAELYSTKSKSFHGMSETGDTLLMARYMETLVNNASYKVVRQYTNLQIADNRAKIEEEIRTAVNEQLQSEKLGNALSLTVVQVRNILPNATILESATAFIKSQNELKIKENEVTLAQLESKRMLALAQNSTQSIAYMQAQALASIAEGVKNGKVNSIVIPYNFAGMINVK